MSSNSNNKTIGIGPVNLSPADHAAIKWVLDRENKNGDSTNSYVLLENQPAEKAQILVASVNRLNAQDIKQTIYSEHGEKSTIYVADDPSVVNTFEDKYMIRQEALGDTFIELIEKISEEELKPTPEQNSIAESTGSLSVTISSLSKKPVKSFGRILVVDDSASVRTQMDIYLSKRKFNIELAESAEQAISFVSEQKFNMIFLDVIMPGADGYQTCKVIKSIESAKETPVIMLTSKNNPIDKIHGIMSGCDEYIVKPVKSSELTELLKRYFPNFKKIVEARSNQ